ncbi:hypothetical protein K8T06_07355, partial [bacterium]|nr:hypothetical protein [bacterium]
MTDKTRILLKNIKIFDTDTEQFTGDLDIFIRNGNISAIGKMDSAEYLDTQIIDCIGKYAIPGLWECHAHLVPLTATNPVIQKDVLKEFDRP